MHVISETYLKQHFGLNTNGEICLPKGCELSSGARALLQERNIHIRYINERGEVFIEDNEQKVHPLKLSNTIPDCHCVLCGSALQDKPAYMTHLDDKNLVPKNHPRIQFRGEIDAVTCECVEIQCLFAENNIAQLMQNSLSDVRSYLGQVMQAEVLNTPLPLATICNKESEEIHQWSHFPLKYLGYDHILPDMRFGLEVAKLNSLRASVRRLEMTACSLYIDSAYNVSREDIIAGLNSLSSVIYVLMIMVWQFKQGNGQLIEQLFIK